MIVALQRLVRNPLRALGAARLTWLLLAAALVLLFAGTLAQTSGSAEEARARFFLSWLVLIGPLPLPGIKLIGVVAALNLLAAAIRRRGPLGVQLARAGLVALIATGFAAEALQRTSLVMLPEGGTAGSSFDPSSWDLRLEPLDVAAPLEALREGEALPGAPSIILERHFENSRPLVGPSASELSSLAPLRRESNSADNRPGVILRVSSVDGPVRTVVWAGRPMPVGGSPGVTARLARREVPLAAPITLVRLEASRHPGSETPRCVVAHLRTGAGSEAAEVLLRPNRPLRLGRDKVYLISQGTSLEGEPALILGVRRDPAGPAFYAAGLLIVAGLALQAASRGPSARPAAGGGAASAGRGSAAALALVLWLLSPASGVARDLVPLRELGRVPVLSGGRLMPLEVFARLTLTEISGSERLEREPAIAWMARMLLAAETTLSDPLFRVERRETLLRAGLATQPGVRLSYRQLEPAAQHIADLAARYSSHPSPGPVEQEIMALARRLTLYTRLAASSDYDSPHEDFAVPAGQGALRLGLSPGPHSLREVARARERLGSRWDGEPAADGLRGALSRWARDYQGTTPAMIPDGEGSWTSAAAALAAGGEPAAHALIVGLARDQYGRGDWEELRRTVGALELAASSGAGEQAARLVRLEVAARRVRPFTVAMVLQGLALALLLAAGGRRYGDAAAAAALLLACASLAGGLLLEAVITSRPPVAALGATFAAAALVLTLAGVAARLARAPRAVPGAAAGAGLLLTAVGRWVASAGDELAVLPAELDAPLWIAAHAGLFVLAYAAALAASGLGHLWLGRRLLAPQDAAALGRLEAALPAVLRVALLLSAAATLLGAAWADRAWGRFWGWDPKEGAALLLVLWIAAVLQGFGARLLRAAGLAAASASLVLPVVFSWLAVNGAQTGLHASGFVAGVTALAAAVSAAELLFLAAAMLLPRRRHPAVPAEQVWGRRPAGEGQAPQARHQARRD